MHTCSWYKCMFTCDSVAGIFPLLSTSWETPSAVNIMTRMNRFFFFYVHPRRENKYPRAQAFQFCFLTLFFFYTRLFLFLSLTVLHTHKSYDSSFSLVWAQWSSQKVLLDVWEMRSTTARVGVLTAIWFFLFTELFPNAAQDEQDSHQTFIQTVQRFMNISTASWEVFQLPHRDI